MKDELLTVARRRQQRKRHKEMAFAWKRRALAGKKTCQERALDSKKKLKQFFKEKLNSQHILNANGYMQKDFYNIDKELWKLSTSRILTVVLTTADHCENTAKNVLNSAKKTQKMIEDEFQGMRTQFFRNDAVVIARLPKGQRREIYGTFAAAMISGKHALRTICRIRGSCQALVQSFKDERDNDCPSFSFRKNGQTAHSDGAAYRVKMADSVAAMLIALERIGEINAARKKQIDQISQQIRGQRTQESFVPEEEEAQLNLEPWMT